MELTLAELEQAINYWRNRHPARGEERQLSPEVNLLARVYAMMIFDHATVVPLASLDSSARQVIAQWRQQVPASAGV
jgi:hypothetical protein